MVVKWFPESKQNLRQIANRCNYLFGSKVAKESIRSIHHQVELLGPNPHLGSIEPQLNHRPETWRSLVVHQHLKAVYLVGSETVNIAALWDTRRNPSTMANYLDRLVQTQPTVLCEPTVPYHPTSKKG